ncbi:MAG: hypothetical protein ABEJ70_02835 [Halobacteriaceae archaeon]
MTVPVRYYCPRCERVTTLARDGYLADKSVTPYPLAGWRYAAVGEDYGSADGVRVVCGETDPAVDDDGDDEGGCGEPFYLNFVRFEDGEAVEPRPERETVDLAPPGPRGPSGPGR